MSSPGRHPEEGRGPKAMRRGLPVKLWAFLVAVAVIAAMLGYVAERWRRGGFAFQQQEDSLNEKYQYFVRRCHVVESGMRAHIEALHGRSGWQSLLEPFFKRSIQSLKAIEDPAAHEPWGHVCPTCKVVGRTIPELFKELDELRRKYAREAERHRWWAGPHFGGPDNIGV